MARYFFTSKLDVTKTVRSALECNIDDIRIIDCSGTSVGYWIDMDLSILTDEERKYVSHFAEKQTTEEERIQELVDEGMSRSDAQACYEAEQLA